MIDENGLIIPGQLDLTCKIEDRGHFEGGKWVTILSPLFEYFRDNNIEDTKHELIVTVEIPIFKRGVCTGYQEKEKSLGLFTSAELQEIIEIEVVTAN